MLFMFNYKVSNSANEHSRQNQVLWKFEKRGRAKDRSHTSCHQISWAKGRVTKAFYGLRYQTGSFECTSEITNLKLTKIKHQITTKSAIYKISINNHSASTIKAIGKDWEKSWRRKAQRWITSCQCKEFEGHVLKKGFSYCSATTCRHEVMFCTNKKIPILIDHLKW